MRVVDYAQKAPHWPPCNKNRWKISPSTSLKIILVTLSVSGKVLLRCTLPSTDCLGYARARARIHPMTLFSLLEYLDTLHCILPSTIMARFRFQGSVTDYSSRTLDV